MTGIIFGEEYIQKRVEISCFGERKRVSIGLFLKVILFQHACKSYRLHRLLFGYFNNAYIGQREMDLYRNIIQFRELVSEIIEERKEEMRSSDIKDGTDFLTLLLLDDLYKCDETAVLDECIMLLFASLPTCQQLLYNALYYLTSNPRCLE